MHSENVNLHNICLEMWMWMRLALYWQLLSLTAILPHGTKLLLLNYTVMFYCIVLNRMTVIIFHTLHYCCHGCKLWSLIIQTIYSTYSILISFNSTELCYIPVSHNIVIDCLLLCKVAVARHGVDSTILLKVRCSISHQDMSIRSFRFCKLQCEASKDWTCWFSTCSLRLWSGNLADKTSQHQHYHAERGYSHYGVLFTRRDVLSLQWYFGRWYKWKQHHMNGSTQGFSA